MIYLEEFTLPDEMREYKLICGKRNIFNSVYPFRIFPEKEFEHIELAPITIFYGNNGSGKTTLLNVISNSIHASRKSMHKMGELFDQYVSWCSFCLRQENMTEIKMISSDDVFDKLLDLRAINNKINRMKDEISDEYYHSKYNLNTQNVSGYDELKNVIDSRRMTSSKYIRSRLSNNTVIEQSNGETALEFWQNEVLDNSLYLLDEPENSLSPQNQLKLAEFIEESARFFNCQFIISTHSPFLLGIKDARIYNLDSVPVKVE